MLEDCLFLEKDSGVFHNGKVTSTVIPKKRLKTITEDELRVWLNDQNIEPESEAGSDNDSSDSK